MLYMLDQSLKVNLQTELKSLYYEVKLKSGPLPFTHTLLENSHFLNQHRKISEYMARTTTTTPGKPIHRSDSSFLPQKILVLRIRTFPANQGYVLSGLRYL